VTRPSRPDGGGDGLWQDDGWGFRTRTADIPARSGSKVRFTRSPRSRMIPVRLAPRVFHRPGSRALAAMTRRPVSNWRANCGHGPLLAGIFIDPGRFPCTVPSRDRPEPPGPDRWIRPVERWPAHPHGVPAYPLAFLPPWDAPRRSIAPDPLPEGSPPDPQAIAAVATESRPRSGHEVSRRRSRVPRRGRGGSRSYGEASVAGRAIMVEAPATVRRTVRPTVP